MKAKTCARWLAMAACAVLIPDARAQPRDKDDDGIADDCDRCPEEVEDLDGVDDADGCPEVDALDAVISFSRGRANVDAGRYGSALDQIAVYLRTANGKLRVEAHASDDEGDDGEAFRLSRARADAVRKLLHGRGVPEDRMQLAPYGRSGHRVLRGTAGKGLPDRVVVFALRSVSADTLSAPVPLEISERPLASKPADEPSRWLAPITRHYFLLVQRVGELASSFDVDVTLNGERVALFRNGQEGKILDLTSLLLPGENTIAFEQRFTCVQTPHSPGAGVMFMLGEGQQAAGSARSEGVVKIDTPLVRYLRSAEHGGPAREEARFLAR